MALEKHAVKKKIGAAVLSVAIAAGAAGAPDAEALEQGTQELLSPGFAAVETVDMPAGPEDVSFEDEEDEEKQKFSLGSVLTYAAGAILSFLTFLLNTPLGPVASKIVSWVILAAAVFGAVAIGLKKAFPNLPLSKVLSPKTALVTVFGILVLIAACEIIGYYREEIVLALKIGAIVLAGVLVIVVVRKVKKAFRRKKTVTVSAA